MSVVVVGVNQRSIPIDAFEKLAIDDDHLLKVLDDYIDRLEPGSAKRKRAETAREMLKSDSR